MTHLLDDRVELQSKCPVTIITGQKQSSRGGCHNITKRDNQRNKRQHQKRQARHCGALGGHIALIYKLTLDVHPLL